MKYHVAGTTYHFGRKCMMPGNVQDYDACDEPGTIFSSQVSQNPGDSLSSIDSSTHTTKRGVPLTFPLTRRLGVCTLSIVVENGFDIRRRACVTYLTGSYAITRVLYITCFTATVWVLSKKALLSSTWTSARSERNRATASRCDSVR